MSTHMSNFAEGVLLDLFLRNQNYTGGQVFLALFSTTCSDSTLGTELAYSGYARQTFGATPADAFSAPASGQTAPVNQLQFPVIPAATTVTVASVAIMTASSGGSALFYRNLDTPITYSTGMIPIYGPNNTTISITSGVASGLSTWARNWALNVLLRGQNYSAHLGATTMRLLAAAGTADGPLTEVAGAWYTPQSFGSGTGSWTVTGTGSASNANQVTFAAVSGSPVNVHGMACYSPTANPIFFANYPAPVTYNVTDVITSGVGAITLLFD